MISPTNRLLRKINRARLLFVNRHYRKNLYNKGTVIFLHIPKTAGSALQSIIQSHYRARETHRLDSKRTLEAMADFKAMDDEEKKELKVVCGHMWFGLHEAIPGPSTYITLLRDPVDRVISHYYYVRRMPGHYLYQKVTQEKLSLQEYVEKKLSTELNNGQTRLLSGQWDEKKYPFGSIPRSLLEQAKNNLQQFFLLVGIQEEFETTIKLAGKLLGWQSKAFKENVNPKRPSLDAISAETRQVIEYYNSLDIELYNYAREIFAELKIKHLA